MCKKRNEKRSQFIKLFLSDRSEAPGCMGEGGVAREGMIDQEGNASGLTLVSTSSMYWVTLREEGQKGSQQV